MYIKVRVTTKSKKELLIKHDSTNYDVFVTEDRKRGSANNRVISLLRSEFEREGEGLIVKMVKGGSSSSKIFLVEYKHTL